MEVLRLCRTPDDAQSCQLGSPVRHRDIDLSATQRLQVQSILFLSLGITAVYSAKGAAIKTFHFQMGFVKFIVAHSIPVRFV